MPFSNNEYDHDNRFMRCVMEHKMSITLDSPTLKNNDIDVDNRFQRCVTEHKLLTPLTPSPSPRLPSSPRSGYNRFDSLEDIDIQSVSTRENRTLSISSVSSNSNGVGGGGRYPNSRLRPRAISSQDARSSQDACSLQDSPSKNDILDEFPSLQQTTNSPVLTPKTPVLPQLRSPLAHSLSSRTPKKDSDLVALSVLNGKAVQREIVELSCEPPPLVITPSKWSDVLRNPK